MNKYEMIKIIIMVIFTVGSFYFFNKYKKNGEYVFHDKYPSFILNTRTGEVKDLRTGEAAFKDYKATNPYEYVE